MSSEFGMEHCHGSGTCPTVAAKEVQISVPVSIRAFAEVGDIRTTCIGAAVITPNGAHPRRHCDNVFKFVISQCIKVDVPVVFGCNTEVGEACADFEESSGGDCGCN